MVKNSLDLELRKKQKSVKRNKIEMIKGRDLRQAERIHGVCQTLWYPWDPLISGGGGRGFVHCCREQQTLGLNSDGRKVYAVYSPFLRLSKDGMEYVRPVNRALFKSGRKI